MTLELLISTHAARIAEVAEILLPFRSDVCYLVAWQRMGVNAQIPEALKRPDVRIVETCTYGLSANRNVALRNACGDVLLLSDSDCRYTETGFDCILQAFTDCPEADVLLFQATTPEGLPLHYYPQLPYDYARRPRGAQASSWEIAMRRSDRLPAFDLRFGIGAPLLACGEEEIFLQDCLSRGLTVNYIPQVVVQTPGGTTGTRFLTDAGVRRAKGAVSAYLYGRSGATARCLKFAIANVPWGMKAGAWRDMLDGIRLLAPQHYNRVFPCTSAISVVIPYRNRRALLPRTLESLLMQSHRPLTVILIDNGSTDAGADYCREFAERHSSPDFRVTLLSSPTGGASAARNVGLAAVETPYVCFFDSDDVFDPFFLDTLLPRLEEGNGRDIVFATTRMVFEKGRTKKRAFPRLTLQAHLLTGMISTQSFIARTDFIRQVGGWNEHLPKWNDYELGVRILQACPRTAWVPGRAFHRIYQHADSLTGSSLADHHQQLYPALSAIARLVAPTPRLRAAFAFRQTALAALWMRAGLTGEGKKLLHEMLRSHLPWGNRIALLLLFIYMRIGGAGSWRIYDCWLGRR